ncbi:MAG: hypothetical protein D5R99_07805 [Methanocalculus sp. MSAO_Arc1]|uniref:hypothetical protein n=1 Tax=Methanocalculus TaxID=71151 RepID=UPI000FF3D4CC|nr:MULTISPECIES: hypothetical protein [unclassified Methanocalculus]MCP1663304.1 hypothetical protein [Methanocalculus sp. AMF5]RQD79574.1 MAG: hypothetical protein D5R99_07805 [Methanocalculus sp. MSAO_Arc1]
MIRNIIIVLLAALLFCSAASAQVTVAELEIIDRSTGNVVADFHDDHWHGELPHIHEGDDIELMANFIGEDGAFIPLYHGSRNPDGIYAMSARIADGAPAGFARVSDHGDHVHIYGDHEGDTYVVFQLLEQSTRNVVWESGQIEVEVEEGHLSMGLVAGLGAGIILVCCLGYYLYRKRCSCGCRSS